MGNVLRVFARDVKRLFKAPAALVVAVVLVILPSLYTWFNVAGFWNPYDNTGNLRVCVVNEDAGAGNELMGELDLGAQVVAQLESNDQLGWTFTDRDTALEEVRSGASYAAFVIPEDFSESFATLLTADVRRPQLEYYVNEKAGAVSPKITDTGATTLDQTINSTFVSTVSSVVADTLDAKLAETKGKLDASEANVAARFEQAKESIADGRAALSGLVETTAAAAGKTEDAQGSLAGAKDDIAHLSDQLASVSSLTATAQDDAGAFAAKMSSALDKGSLLASQAASKAGAAVGAAAGAAAKAQGDVDGAIASGRAALEQNRAVIDELERLQKALPDGDPGKELAGQAVEGLKERTAELERALALAETASDAAAGAATALIGASGSATGSVEDALAGADGYRDALSSKALPAVHGGLAQLGSTASGLSAAVSNQQLLVDQASLALDQLGETLRTSADALDQTDGLLADLEGGLDTVQTDLAALGTSGALSSLLDGGTLDAAKIADFMLSPTEVSTEKLYPLNAYGSAMAPLFTNLTLWIGAFMLLVILKQEVDDEGVKNLTISQRYLGRWLFLAVFAALQAVVCCTGDLVMGVQAASVPLFYLTAVAASLTYLSIQYALSVTLQHIGKGICVILVFAQIPGATGLYPIEMTPSFFQAVYPFFPFTYGINAMRETIGGFYDGQWGQLVGMLLVFLAVSFVVGLALRPYFTNLNRMFAKQIAQSDILNGEEVQLPARRFRVAQLTRALADREEYRVRLRDHAQRFLAWYPHLLHGAWFFGIAVPTVATVALSVAGSARVVVLTAWLVWLVAVLLFLVVLEHVRDSLERQTSLGDLSDDELRALFVARTSLDGGPAPSAEGARERKGASHE